MRIVFTTHAYSPAIGGAERYAQGLAEEFVRRGHEVHVLTPNLVSAEGFYEYGHGEAGPPSDTIGGVCIHRLTVHPPRRVFGRGNDPFDPHKARIMWDRYGAALTHELDQLDADVVVTLPHAFPNVEPTLVWSGGDAAGEGFVSLDDRLREAARREGFEVLPERL